MPHVDHRAGVIQCKLVYGGPARAGKSTNLRHIHGSTRPEDRGQLILVTTEDEKAMFFDLRIPTMAEFRGRLVRFYLYTFPGPAFFATMRKRHLRGVDGLVFVADSQAGRLAANIDALAWLESSVHEEGHELAGLPMVMQYNKRELPDALPVAELDAALNPTARERFAASAVLGAGVLDTFRALAWQVAARLPTTLHRL